ncbi:MAG: hypothetical protein JNJ54_06145 [Myxococcaceae bacterium]|nr:hypothetical protein [Myxococcaceae bacterium]
MTAKLGSLVVLLLLLSSGASAQIVRPMGETPGELGPAAPDRTEPQPPTAAQGPRSRFSLLSAGRGGPLFAFSQIVDGLVVGAAIGASITSSPSSPLALSLGAYLGALAGGVGLGGLGVLLQYFQPIGLVAAGAATLGLGVGALSGLGVALLLEGFVSGLPAVLPGVLALAGSQIGALVPLALLWTAEDLDPSELAMMAAASLWLTAAVGLVNLSIGRPLVAPALLIAPAVGMAAGGLVAALTRVSSGEVFRYTALPLGVGAATFFIGGLLGGSPQIAAIASLSMIALTVLTTGLVSFATTAPAPAEVTLLPTISVLPAGRASEGVAVGPAALVRF